MTTQRAIGSVFVVLLVGVALLWVLRYRDEVVTRNPSTAAVRSTAGDSNQISRPSALDASASAAGTDSEDRVEPASTELHPESRHLRNLESLPPPQDAAMVRAWQDALRVALDAQGSEVDLLAVLQALDGMSFENEFEADLLRRSRDSIAAFLREHPEHLPLALDLLLSGSSNSAFCISGGLKLAVSNGHLDSIAREWAERYTRESVPTVQEFLAVNCHGIGDPSITESIIGAELNRRDDTHLGLSRALRAIQISLDSEARLRELWDKQVSRVRQDHPSRDSIPDSSRVLFDLLVERASAPYATVDELRSIRAFLSKHEESAEAIAVLDELLVDKK